MKTTLTTIVNFWKRTNALALVLVVCLLLPVTAFPQVFRALFIGGRSQTTTLSYQLGQLNANAVSVPTETDSDNHKPCKLEEKADLGWLLSFLPFEASCVETQTLLSPIYSFNPSGN